MSPDAWIRGGPNERLILKGTFSGLASFLATVA
jgi:hypothetical protein